MANFKYTKVASGDAGNSEHLDESANAEVPEDYFDIEMRAFPEEKPKRNRRHPGASRHLHTVMPDFVYKADIRGRAYIKQFRWVSVFAIVIGMFSVALFCVYFIFEWSWWHGHLHKPALSLAELRNGTYTPGIRPIDWVPTGENGLYSTVTPDGFFVSHWTDGSHANAGDLRKIAPRYIKTAEDDERRYIHSVLLNKQQTHVLAKTEVEKHWRHSTYAHYWILAVENEGDDGAKGDDDAKEQAVPILLRDEKISVAEWNPDGSSIAYVYDHNLYVYNLSTNTTRQITTDGGDDIFNGIPDWVYEEEVFAGDSAIWWNPTGDYLAYLRTNDSLVPKFPIPYFLSKAHDSDAVAATKRRSTDSSSDADSDNPGKYPSLVELKYPKPGFPNPQVELWLYSPHSPDHPTQIVFDTDLYEPIIIEVVWVGKQAVIKIIDREADHLEVWVADPSVNSVTRSRSYASTDLDGAWFEITHNTHAVGDSGYIDTINVDGYNHLAYFSPVNATEPVILTRGKWEVLDKAIGVNQDSGYVYFHATKNSSMSSLIYGVSIDHPDKELAVLLPSEDGDCTAVFSPDATFASTTCENAYTPLSQRVLKLTGDSGDCDLASNVVEDNAELKELLDSRHVLDENLVHYGTIELGNGISVNYREIRPTNFDPKRKHPLLFFNYGGPASQTVKYNCRIDFQRVFAETHNAVVVSVDPRGTAGRGRKFMSVVRDHLGEFEADDVIEVAKIFNKKKYIDEDTTAIWGWSYGGFLTLKVLERDEDLAFKYGVAVAPVTDFSLYDSIYTERYMHTPEHNKDGYLRTSVHNMTNLARHDRFLVMHGTGDDNVHFQNTLNLLDNLDQQGVENYDVHIYPDSDHSISFHNANVMVYDRIDQWLAHHQNNKKHHSGRN